MRLDGPWLGRGPMRCKVFYSHQVLDHFTNPRNVGEIEEADGVGLVGDPACGDFMKVWIKVDGNTIVDVKFKCQGCPASIATGSIMTEMTIGRNLDEAMELTDEQIADALGGLPANKMHCSNLGAEALYHAVTDHVLRFIGKIPQPQER